MILLYHALQTRYSTHKQRSWIITTLSSATMSLCSAPFVFDVLFSRGDITALQPRLDLAALICRTFQGFLLADLVAGCRYYRRHITIGWGWIHHSAYIVLLHYMIQRGWAPGFCLCAVMELPTFQLSLSFLHPRLRHDLLFCASFFATRIIFHLFVFGIFCSPAGVSLAQGSRLPATFLALAFPGHLVWFAQSVRGAIRRRHRSVRKRDMPRAAFLNQALVCATLVSVDDMTPLWERGNMPISTM
ncbi:hypothetical protein B0H15DRAFT_783607 [Mycena belliarum]|uniref:TLC domain-containing protein n=1 Tax=Mycena belliarum TaxID=1033014 RepID=A0AAD6U1R0_9AGAR|nr:hypothetical protein B0H15DRAFT_783607 [Mycena belliae]